MPINDIFGKYIEYCLMGKHFRIWSDEEVITISCPKTNTAPKIDGVLNDDGWKKAEKITNFVINEDVELVKEQTIVFLTRDAKNLYLGFSCVEPNMDKLVKTVKKIYPI